MHVVLPLFQRRHLEERGPERGGQTSAAEQPRDREIAVPPPGDVVVERADSEEAGTELGLVQLELVGPPELEDWLERGSGLVPMHVADGVVGLLVVAAREQSDCWDRHYDMRPKLKDDDIETSDEWNTHGTSRRHAICPSW